MAIKLIHKISIMKKEIKKDLKKFSLNLTPKQIVEELDRYIVGQNEAKKSVAIALRNRFRRKAFLLPLRFS